MIFNAEKLYYIQKKYTYRGFKKISSIISRINVVINGVDIGVGAMIGPGLKIYHGVGLVIGSAVRIGNNFTCFQNVTIGTRNITMVKIGRVFRSPIIGDNVIVYPQSIIFGPVEIGNDVVIGAHCVVSKNVPDFTTLSAGIYWQ